MSEEDAPLKNLEDFSAQLGNKKKKKRDVSKASESGASKTSDKAEGSGSETPGGTPTATGEGYFEKVPEGELEHSYPELLARIFKTLREQNPELAGERKKYSIVPPSIHREGNKKTLFANLTEICKKLNRPPEHLIQFLFTELGTTGSIDGSQRLIIKGRFQQKQIENVLKRYIVEYVTCKTCKSPKTSLRRENRLFFQQCEDCGSTRSVSTIKTGFKAQTEKRSAMRNKEL